MSDDLDKPMEDGHEALLKTITRTEPHKDLPKNVVKRYWDFKKAFDRLKANIGVETLATIAILANVTTPDAPQTFFDETPQFDARVVGKFRNKMRIGHWKGNEVNKKYVNVQFDDDTEIRKLSPTNVRLITREEEKEYLPAECL